MEGTKERAENSTIMLGAVCAPNYVKPWLNFAHISTRCSRLLRMTVLNACTVAKKKISRASGQDVDKVLLSFKSASGLNFLYASQLRSSHFISIYIIVNWLNIHMCILYSDNLF